MNAVRSDQIFSRHQGNGGISQSRKDCPVIARPANFRLRSDSSVGENWLKNVNFSGPSSLSSMKAHVVSGTAETLFDSARSRNALINSVSKPTPRSCNSTPGRNSSVGRNTTPSRSPRTPNTATNGGNETKCIVALTEGRGKCRGEVGIAAIDVYRPHLVVSQISDCQTYQKTMTKISILSPVEILLPNTFCDGSTSTKLFNCVKDQYPTITITTVQRRHFNDVLGMELIKKLCVPELSSVEILVQNRFYALSAAAALLKYIEFLQNIIFAPKSLSIQYQGSQNTTLIDIETAKRLELVCPMRPAANWKQCSLLGILNNTATIGGYRLLRATVLQPSCLLQDIVERQECVQELVENPTLFRAFQCILPKFADCERLLALSMMVPTSAHKCEKSVEYQLNYALLLKSCLENLPALRETLANGEHPLFISFLQRVRSKSLDNIQDCIKRLLHDDAKSVKGYSSSCIQRCFAIKSELHVLLDLARKKYCELVDEITYVVKSYAEEFGLPLKVGHNVMKGFHIQMAVGGANKKLRNFELPNIFIQVNKTRSTFTMTTQAVVNLDMRSKEMLKEIQSMSATVLSELLAEVRQHAGCLYQMCEAISQIDMICAITAASSLPGFVKPKFGGKIAVCAGKHPILNHIGQMEPIPNDIFSSEENNFHVVTGPNMAGKSIYIRQVALLQIMAQIGCFVPAESAEFRITDRIFSRIGFEDSIEGNASTFVVEMREMNFILQQMTPTSLIIIDELCRGTSSEEGTSIAWALCENLLRSPAFTFFTTHFLYLTRLQNMYSNVNNLCLEAIEKPLLNRGNNAANDEEGEEKWIRYTHKMIPGVMQVEKYGLRLAKLSRMPKDVTDDADTILSHLIAVRKPLPSIENGEQASMLYQTFRCMLKVIAEKYIDDPASAKSKNLLLTHKFKEQHPNWREELMMPGTPLPTPRHLATKSARMRFISPVIQQLHDAQDALPETPVVIPDPTLCDVTDDITTPQLVPGSKETPKGILKNPKPQNPEKQTFKTPTKRRVSSPPKSSSSSVDTSAPSTPCKSLTPLKMKMRKIEDYFVRVQKENLLPPENAGSMSAECDESEKTAVVEPLTVPDCESNADLQIQIEEIQNQVIHLSPDPSEEIQLFAESQTPVNQEVDALSEPPEELEVVVEPKTPPPPQDIEVKTPPPLLPALQKEADSLDALLKSAMKRINFATPSPASNTVSSFSFGAASFTMPGAAEVQPEIAPLKDTLNEKEGVTDLFSTPVSHRFELQPTPEFSCTMSFKEFMAQREKRKRRGTQSSSQMTRSPDTQKFMQEFPPSTPQLREASRTLDETLEQLRRETPSSAKRLFVEGGWDQSQNADCLALELLMPPEPSPVITKKLSSHLSQL
ncbi:mutS protein homolog 4-like [Cloeon dipterum]|uniref:mutS protein homolog 4-like n=1 Tax=Cloeon dipterum TaxID=197152 RepID=UPI00321FBD7F